MTNPMLAVRITPPASNSPRQLLGNYIGPMRTPNSLRVTGASWLALGANLGSQQPHIVTRGRSFPVNSSWVGTGTADWMPVESTLKTSEGHWEYNIAKKISTTDSRNLAMRVCLQVTELVKLALSKSSSSRIRCGRSGRGTGGDDLPPGFVTSVVGALVLEPKLALARASTLSLAGAAAGTVVEDDEHSDMVFNRCPLQEVSSSVGRGRLVPFAEGFVGTSSSCIGCSIGGVADFPASELFVTGEQNFPAVLKNFAGRSSASSLASDSRVESFDIICGLEIGV